MKMKSIEKKSPIKIVSTVLIVIIMTILFAYCISLIFPLIWTVLTSFKGYDEYYLQPFGFPEKFLWENYVKVFDRLTITVTKNNGAMATYGIFEMFYYSILFSVGYSVFFTGVTALVSYVMARYDFPGKTFLFNLGIVIMILPIVGSGTSMMTLYRQFGVYNNMLLFILVGPTTAFSGTNFLLLYNTFKNLPASYSEAAYIDGAGEWNILTEIMFPMALPTMAALGVMGFISAWNSYATFLIWLPGYASLAYGMYNFQYYAPLYETTMPEILAGYVIVMVPTCVLYVFAQKLVMSKLTVGGLKG